MLYPNYEDRRHLLSIVFAAMACAAGASAQSLSTQTLTVGSGVGGSDILFVNAPIPYGTTTNYPWLHPFSVPFSSVTGFNCDAFTGTGTRTGTIGYQNINLAVTQVGTNYVAVNPVTTLASGLSSPTGVAVDASGNVFIADQQANAFKKWSASAGLVTTAETTLTNFGVATDAAGNVYIADEANNAIKKWNASSKAITTLVSGLHGPYAVAVDAAGVNVYIADTGAGNVDKWNSTNGLTTLVSSLPNPEGVAVDALGNVYISDPNLGTIKEWNASSASASTLISTPGMVPLGVAVDATGIVYVADLGHHAVQKYNPYTGQLTPLVTLQTPEGVGVDPSGIVYIVDAANNKILKYNSAFETLGTTVQSFGGGAGKGSVVLGFLPVNSTVPWTASTGSSWLHVTTATGTGGGLIQFQYDANTAATPRTGFITLDSGLQLTIVQNGNSYIPAWPVSTSVSGLADPIQVAVDAAHNIFITDYGNNAIRELSPTSGLSTLVSSGLSLPAGVAVDQGGDIYIVNLSNNALRDWVIPVAGLATLNTTALSQPSGLALDALGNVFISNNSSIKEYNVATGLVTTVPINGLRVPGSVATDVAGNVYVADTGHSAIDEWNPVDGQVTALVSSGLSGPEGVAVDGAGNVYIADTMNNAIKMWSPASGVVTTLLASGLNQPYAVTVDGDGQIYISDTFNGRILTAAPDFASLGTTALPGGGNLSVSSFAQTVGSAAGSSSVVVSYAGSSFNGWSASTSTAWLHVAATGSGVVVYTYDANPSTAARTGTITVDGSLTLSVTQYGVSYAVAKSVATLESGLTQAYLVSVDAAGNVYFGNGAAIQKRSAPGGAVTNVVTSGLIFPAGLAADGAGNLYIADALGGTVEKWSAPSGPLTTVVPGSAGLAVPNGIAVDAAGNIYIADFGNGRIAKWNAGGGLVTLVPGVSQPVGLALDGEGNVYFSEKDNNSVVEWIVATGQQTIVVPASAGLNAPVGVAVDGAGNIYIADSGNGAIKQWNAATGQLTTLASGLAGPWGVAVDGKGNVYATDASAGTLLKINIAFETLGTTAQNVDPGAGTNTVVVGFLPTNSTSVWTASTATSWLHITTGTGTGGGNVTYTYDANTAVAPRSGTITFDSGATLTVTQAGVNYASSFEFTGISGTTPYKVAADGEGNVYIADTGNLAIEKWTLSTGVLSTLVSGVGNPQGIAVDGAGNVYFGDDATASVKEWIAATGTVTTLVPNGAALPSEMTLDGAGNLYFVDTLTIGIRKWSPSAGLTTAIGAVFTGGVTADAAGNLYFPNTLTNALNKWSPITGVATPLTTITNQDGVAVDGGGNVYISLNTTSNAVSEWTAATGAVSAFLTGGAANPHGVAVDAAANVYIAETGANRVDIFYNGFASTAAVTEPATAGTDALPRVIPANTPLTGANVPTSDQTWLTIGSVANGVVNFSFTTNSSGAARTAHIGVFGQSIAVTQKTNPAQTITFNPLGNVTLGTAPFVVTAPTNSGLKTTLTSNTPSVCTTTGDLGHLVTVLTSGLCSITATQAGNAAWAAATPVTGKFTVEYSDVTPAELFFNQINAFAQDGITNGCATDEFCPSENVTRDQMAVFIVRSVYGGDNFTYSPTPYFTDVPPTYLFFKWIQKLKDLGITSGCTATTYCPGEVVTRDQMAIFIIRARLGVAIAGSSPTFTYPSAAYFTDATAANEFAFPWIQRMRLENITSGCTSTTYCSTDPVTRDEMATFIMRGAFNQFLPAGTPVVASISPSTLPMGAVNTTFSILVAGDDYD
jgi:streptogramin lyase